MNQELLNFYKEYKDKVNAYHFALSTMYFDQATIAPKKGADYANTMTSILAGECFAYECNPENIKKIEELYASNDDQTTKKELELRLKALNEVASLPKETYIAYQKCVADCETVWHEAKQKQDYALFKPHLESVFKMLNEVLSYNKKPTSAYNKLLDQYQDGMTQEKYDVFFDKIKETLLPFIQKIKQEGKKIDDSILFTSFDIKKQEAFMEKIQDYLHVDRETCYMGTTEHPFTSSFSLQDARITTHYYENNVMSAILSTIHEYGHALYGLQVNPAFAATTLETNIGMALHESQSRFLENHIGRSRAFWEINYPLMQQYFSQLKSITLDEFMEMINITRCSLIRTEADELTYPIHILIRYELEKELFEGKLDFNNLDRVWADRYEQYLGVRPANDAEGILQDTHWSGASFGYFPTYAYGSAVAAQLYHQLCKDIDVEDALKNDFTKITKWLKEHVHQYGALKTIDEILIETTKEPFNPDYYINYLINKFSKIYGIQ